MLAPEISLPPNDPGRKAPDDMLWLGPEGIEPPLAGHEPAVLPLDDGPSPLGGSNPHCSLERAESCRLD